MIDFFYRPFQKWLSPQLFRYAACGGGNLVLDWVLYFLIYNFVIGHDLVFIDLSFLSPFEGGLRGSIPFFEGGLSWSITPHIATLCIVFPITLFTGFWLNRNITFTQSSLRGWRQLSRYILIVGVNLAINYFGLKLCVDFLGWYPTPSKMAITLLTIAISYFGQKYFTFRS